MSEEQLRETLREALEALRLLGGRIKQDGSLEVDMAKWNATHRCARHRGVEQPDACVLCLQDLVKERERVLDLQADKLKALREELAVMRMGHNEYRRAVREIVSNDENAQLKARLAELEQEVDHAAFRISSRRDALEGK